MVKKKKEIQIFSSMVNKKIQLKSGRKGEAIWFNNSMSPIMGEKVMR